MDNPWKKFVPQAPTRQGSADWFTGQVYVSELIASPEPMHLTVARVFFSPKARTHWHTHPKGQILHVLEGIGWFQREGDEVLEIKAGDTLYIPPGEKHWHGASAAHAMTHLAMHAAENGKSAQWLEAVSDEEYKADG